MPLELLVLVRLAGGLRPLVVPANPLDAGSDIDVTLPGPNRVRRLPNRIEAGRAIAGDREAVDGDRQLLREKHDDASDVEGLETLGHATATNQVLHGFGGDVGVALQKLIDDVGSHVVGPQLSERALEGPSDRRANGIDYDCFGHCFQASLRTT